jgi:hypothetical protein
MITDKDHRLLKIRQENQAAREEIRRKLYPNIPQEIFFSLENFLFFMGNYATLFNW